MDIQAPYYRQVALLMQVLPYVAVEREFALKGGTAINLFIRDFPRLSVDIDLAWVPLESRAIALPHIRDALARIAANLQQQAGMSAVLQANRSDEMRVIVTTDSAQIKIEVSPVARGTLYPPQEREVVGAVEDVFGYASLPVVSLPDLYGGKLCAALDRQHPRDFYDVKLLLDAQELDRPIFNGFIVYLLSHNRPLAEVLNPRWKDIAEPFYREFSGMTYETIALEELTADVFLRLWNSRNRLRDGSDLAPYLAAIARNGVKNRFRMLGKQPPVRQSYEDLTLSDAKDLCGDAEMVEMIACLLRALDSLCEPDRSLMIRFYFYGEKTSALAKAYHMTDAAVRLRLHRSRGKLRKLMTERGFDHVE